MANDDFSELKPKVVLGVVAHPDDMEFTSAGTVAKFAAEGAQVYYYILTNANKGSEDRGMEPDRLRDMRRGEQRAAGNILGLADVFFGDYDDGTLECNQAVKRDITRVIRQVKPDVVITLDPSVLYVAGRGIINHPDHRAAGQAVLDAVYPLARDHMSFPELLSEGLEPHKTASLLLVNFEKANFYVDITDVLQTKLDALCAHTSQVSDPDGARGMVRAMAEEAGRKAGVPCAEGFVRIDIMP